MVKEITMPDFQKRVDYTLKYYEQNELKEQFIYLLKKAYNQGVEDMKTIFKQPRPR